MAIATKILLTISLKELMSLESKGTVEITAQITVGQRDCSKQ